MTFVSKINQDEHDYLHKRGSRAIDSTGPTALTTNSVCLVQRLQLEVDRRKLNNVTSSVDVKRNEEPTTKKSDEQKKRARDDTDDDGDIE